MATFYIDTIGGTFEGGAGSDVFNINRKGMILHVYGYGGDDLFNFYADNSYDPEAFGGRHNTFDGGDGNDTFDGHGHTVDWLLGGAGNDVFTGLLQGSSAYGGTGNDTYYVDPASPYYIVENPGEGTDTVILTGPGAYVKPDNVENVIAYGGTPQNLPPSGTITGDDLANTLLGTSGADKIYGLGGNDIIRGYAGDDLLDGGSGGDRLYGGAGSDKLYGGDGADQLRGDAGRDEMWGGTGADKFIFDDKDFGGATAATCDVIHDFNGSAGDRIQLNFVDANTLLSLNQAFHFIGTAAFGHVAGELRYQQISGNTFVQGDTNGDGVADFWIQLDGLQTLHATDFVL